MKAALPCTPIVQYSIWQKHPSLQNEREIINFVTIAEAPHYTDGNMHASCPEKIFPYCAFFLHGSFYCTDTHSSGILTFTTCTHRTYCTLSTSSFF